MASIAPIRALRPSAKLAADVAAVPYDVVDKAEARALARGNARSFLHVTKPEIDLDDGVDPYSDTVYQQGAKALRGLVEQGTLVADREPTYSIYELTMHGHVQTGVVLGASVADYDSNIVRKHEHTRPDKENDRVRHIETTRAQTGKVFLVHRPSLVISGLVAEGQQTAPVADFVAGDGIRHRVWVVKEPALVGRITQAFADVGVLYIADGHHRSAAASRVAAAARARGEQVAQHFLSVAFPTDQVKIWPYNRVVRDLNGHTTEQFLAKLRASFDVNPRVGSEVRAGEFGMFLSGAWHTLKPKGDKPRDVVAALDVSVLQDRVLQPLLGISDPRRDKRIDFVGGIRGEAELVKLVEQGFAVAFSMHPTALADVLAVADAGQVMPPKSTWFEPKLRDGLVTLTF